MIQLIKKGLDGVEELDILREIATGHNVVKGLNHALPMLRQLELEDMVFGVLPLVHEVPSALGFLVQARLLTL